MTDNDLIHKPSPETTETGERDTSAEPQVGRWYWIKTDVEDDENQERRLYCVTHVGSNYVALHSAGIDGYATRVHFDSFWSTCTHEPDFERIIDGEIAKYERKTNQLMRDVHELTARLMVSQRPGLTEGAVEMNALARPLVDPNEYKSALVKAKEETLPDLFKQIEASNKAMSAWMKAKVIPYKAQHTAITSVIESIDDRIFSVELYAGLVETVKRCKAGEPAPLGEPIHLFQRRVYMDEECLANYEHGGMTFKNLNHFDRWLAKPKNLNRILPHPRTIAAFQVRRLRAEREGYSLADYFRIMEEERLDKKTFLYIRNGAQLHRLSTEIEFGHKLFPDLDEESPTNGVVYAHVDSGYTKTKVLGFITEDQNEQRIKDLAELEERHRKEVEDAKGEYVSDWIVRDRRAERWHKFSPESVYYDDIARAVGKEIQAHNRIVLILQGLLDRSPVLHPHPPWSLWTEEGFKTALRLIYDDSRVLTPGEKPDFEAYRAKLNASLRTGSITIGQMEQWLREMARIENAKRDTRARYSGRYDREVQRFHPYGDPGPGNIARVAKYIKASALCEYGWQRRRRNSTWHTRDQLFNAKFAVESKHLLNISAYTPGDYRIFFADPRTRADYIQWAPLLLEAEEYHAGNRELGGKE